MIEVTLTELRKDLFRLADAALAGQPVVVRRKGRRLVLQEQAEPIDDRDDDPTPRTPEEFEQAARWERFWAKVEHDAEQDASEAGADLSLEDFDLSDWYEWSGGSLK
jgi:antitoxin (DNA-binding transcriptional repressor) of toxin-antitoxin stability system